MKKRNCSVLICRMLLAVGLGISFSSVASAQNVAYAVAGVETGVIPDLSSSFTGLGININTHDVATWDAVVLRTPFDQNGDATILPGGSFEFDGLVGDLTGEFTGGLIMRLPSGCRRETFAVTGNVALDEGGFGIFSVTLTHYGFRLGAQCIPYFATVEGSVIFTLTQP